MRRRFAVAVAVSGAMVCAVAVPASAATPDTTTLAGSHPAWASPQQRVAAVNPAQPVTFRVYLRQRDAAGADATAHAVTDPHSPQFRHTLTPQQVTDRFGPTAQSVTSLRNWLDSNGFQVGEVPANRAYIEATGSASQAQRAFEVQLNTYRVQGKTLRSADRALTLPRGVANQVLGVVGLDQSLSLLHPQHTTGASSPNTADSARSRGASPNTAPPSAGFRVAPPCSAYYGEKTDTTDPKFQGKTLTYAPCGYKPGQLRSAYGIDRAVSRGQDGRGTRVAIVDAFASPTIFADASEYSRRNDPAHPLRQSQFSQYVFPPTPGSEAPDQCDASGWYGEETLDVEAVHAMAPGANIFYVGSADCSDSALDKALNKIVTEHSADIISNSYGDRGEDIPASEVAAFQQIAQNAAMEGIGLYFSSGDDGDEVANLGHPEADFSASSPWVTAVGGTSLAVGKNGQRLFETGWETGKSTLTGGQYGPLTYNGGAGGGTSVLFEQPTYQRFSVPGELAKHNQTGAKLGRVVPDISAVGDPNTGMLVGQTQTFPDGVYYDQYRIGGTSLACPLIAGIMAVSDQVTGYHHGFINPQLYLLTAHTAGLHDIQHVDAAVARVDYANMVDASQGLITSARTLDYGQLTIHTRPGYDDVTGLGSPNGDLFLLLS